MWARHYVLWREFSPWVFLGAGAKKNLAISLLWRPIFPFFATKPGVIWGCLRLVTATQTTRIPTQTTMTVAVTGTTTSRFSHLGRPGIPPDPPDPSLKSPPLSPPPEPPGPPKAGPTRSESLKKREKQTVITWFETWRESGSLAASKDADDGDGDDDNGDGSNDWIFKVCSTI